MYSVARVLASIEKLDIEFKRKGIFEIKELGKFDLIFCIAVLTEIQDFFGSIEIVKGQSDVQWNEAVFCPAKAGKEIPTALFAIFSNS